MRLTTLAPYGTPGIMPLVLILLYQSDFERYHGVARFRLNPKLSAEIARRYDGKGVFTITYRTEVQI